jgi:hypothetical protein
MCLCVFVCVCIVRLHARSSDQYNRLHVSSGPCIHMYMSRYIHNNTFIHVYIYIYIYIHVPAYILTLSYTCAALIIITVFMSLILFCMHHTYIHLHTLTLLYTCAALIISTVFMFLILFFRPYELRAVNFLQAYAIFCQIMTILRE